MMGHNMQSELYTQLAKFEAAAKQVADGHVTVQEGIIQQSLALARMDITGNPFLTEKLLKENKNKTIKNELAAMRWLAFGGVRPDKSGQENVNENNDLISRYRLSRYARCNSADSFMRTVRNEEKRAVIKAFEESGVVEDAIAEATSGVFSEDLPQQWIEDHRFKISPQGIALADLTKAFGTAKKAWIEGEDKATMDKIEKVLKSQLKVVHDARKEAEAKAAAREREKMSDAERREADAKRIEEGLNAPVEEGQIDEALKDMGID